MGFKLTEEQQTAVDAPVGDNLVSAAAGSGKTKVLSERIVKRIKSGDTSIDRLLIVTFTRAAALQMKERIAAAIEAECAKSGSKSLKRQISMVAGADICTIDAFCINLVKRNFFRAEIPPDFTIADKNEMRILRDEVMADVLDEMYAEADESFLQLAENVGKGKNDNALSDMIMTAYFATRAFEEPDEWLDWAARVHVPGSEENERLFAVIKEELENKVREMGDMLYKARERACECGVEKYINVLESECEAYEKLFSDDQKDISEAAERFVFGDFKGGKRGETVSEEDKNYITDLHNGAKKLFAKIRSLNLTLQSRRGVSQLKIEALVKCVKLFAKLYMQEKLLRKVLEFSDCEYLALKILKENKDVREELRDKYEEIYIDEYQDVNPLQDALFCLISRKERGEANIFIVGDVKQSIYRFRHSDPRVFAEKSKEFGKDENSRKMILSKNFRSRREVIDSVNCVFEKIMHESTAQIEYDEEHALRCGASYIEYNRNKSELYILTGEGEESEEEELLKSEQREALVAAEKIRELIDTGFLVSDGVKMRPIRYSDIAVLSSKINAKADNIAKIFELKGVPAYFQATQNFFDALEIRTIFSILQAVDNPLCDIPLAAAMRSPVFGFSENDLIKIRLCDTNVPFYDNVECKAKKKTKTAKKCRLFLKSLAQWREDAGVLSLEKFVTRVIDDSGYYSFVGALPAGQIRQANLRRFIALAADYEKGQFKGLYNFVRYIEKTIKSGGEIENEVCHSDDSVLVTSIHKSKGLEFGVVIVIGCGWKFNDKDSTANMLINPGGGIAIIERENRMKFKTGEYEALSAMIVRENHAEQMRLLYVAMTRAKEKLIMIGSESGYYKKAAEWEEYANGKSLPAYKIRAMKTYLEYLCCSVNEKYWDVFTVDELPAFEEQLENAHEEREEYRCVEEVIYRLSYEYPFDGMKNVPSKMSVSEIKKLSMDIDESAHFYKNTREKRVPVFLRGEEKLKGNRRGTAFHRVMELIDLDEKNVEKAILGFVQKGFMTKEEADCVETEKVEAFLNSDIAKRMRRAKRIWREESFTISIDAKDVFTEGADEKICVQGTIDCLFEEENGKIVLLDYKTDIYDEPEEIGKRYKKQLELYEVAVFKRFGQKCDEKCLYLFHKNDIITV